MPDDVTAPPLIDALRQRLRDAASDMCPYERKDDTIARLRRQRREAISVANELLATLAPAAPVEGMVERVADAVAPYLYNPQRDKHEVALKALATLDKPQGVGDNG